MKTAKALLLVLLCAAVAYAHNQKAPVVWEPSIDMDGQLFPSFIIATSTLRLEKVNPTKNAYYLGDPTGHIGINVISPSDDTKIRVEVRISDIAEPSGFEGLLKEGGKHYKVFPKIVYRYPALRCGAGEASDGTY
jgi:hypothetical protein